LPAQAHVAAWVAARAREETRLDRFLLLGREDSEQMSLFLFPFPVKCYFLEND